MLAKATFPTFVYIVFRQKWILLVSAVTVISLAVVYCMFATVYYRSECDLYVNFGRDTASPVNTTDGVGQTQDVANQQNILNSLVQMLTSESLADEVITEIGIKKLYPKIVASPPSSGTILGSAERRLLGHDLKVQVAKNANTIQVIYEHPDPELAAETANMLVKKFIVRELALLRDPQSNFLQARLQQYKKQLVQSEAALDDFRNATGISSLDEERSLLLKRRAEIESSIANNQAQVRELENRKQVLGSELTKLPLNVESANEDDALQSQLVQLELQRKALLITYREDSQTVQNVEKQINELTKLQSAGQTRVSKQTPSVSHQEIEVDLNRAIAQIYGIQEAQSTLQIQRAEIEHRLVELAGRNSKLQDLEREYQIADLNYRTYNQYFEQAHIADELNKQKITTISVIEPATPADRPSKPNTPRILLISVGLGVVFSLLIAFFLEGLDERLTLPVQVQDVLKLTVLTSLPLIKEAGAV